MVSERSISRGRGCERDADAISTPKEPDLQGQADMTIAQAVAAWKQYMEPFAGQAKLVAPAITYVFLRVSEMACTSLV